MNRVSLRTFSQTLSRWTERERVENERWRKWQCWWWTHTHTPKCHTTWFANPIFSRRYVHNELIGNGLKMSIDGQYRVRHKAFPKGFHGILKTNTIQSCFPHQNTWFSFATIQSSQQWTHTRILGFGSYLKERALDPCMSMYRKLFMMDHYV